MKASHPPEMKQAASAKKRPAGIIKTYSPSAVSNGSTIQKVYRVRHLARLALSRGRRDKAVALFTIAEGITAALLNGAGKGAA